VLYLVFLVSVFAALLYQIVWQRSLYAIYGINIESVTVIVRAFMLGRLRRSQRRSRCWGALVNRLRCASPPFSTCLSVWRRTRSTD
jgi:hypothetical protein